jgi:hypothetical protein
LLRRILSTAACAAAFLSGLILDNSEFDFEDDSEAEVATPFMGSLHANGGITEKPAHSHLRSSANSRCNHSDEYEFLSGAV